MKAVATSRKRKRQNGTSHRDELLRLAGSMGDLPDDLAINHDFYLHGLPKQQPRSGRWLPRGKALRAPTVAQVNEFNSKLDKLATELDGLPSDLARNLDHYLHGHPKK
jgi:hypothetical protein